MTAQQRSGYYVEQLSALQPAEPQPRVPAKPEAPEPPAKPSAALFPFSVWAKLMRGVILDEGEALLRPMPGAGLYALRRAICDDLLRRRGMHVEPRQVYIGAGAEYFYHLAARILRQGSYLRPRDTRPPQDRAHLRRLWRAVPGHRDGRRRRPARRPLRQRRGNSAPLAVAPLPDRHRHTHRGGGRRFAVADGGGRPLPIETIIDSEFRFSGRPIPPMQTMDFAGRVII